MQLRIVFILIAFFLGASAFAQPGKVPVEEINGKVYHVHTVEKGQTAYGISRMYDVSINELFEQNPEAEKGLSIGQRLLFIAKGETIQSENNASYEGDKLMHTVEEGETLYSIARKYGVPAKDVIDANPQQNLAIGSKVVVPLKNVQKEDEVNPLVKDVTNPIEKKGDSIILHKVKKDETLYSISKYYNISIKEIEEANNGLVEGLQKGMQLRIPLKKKLLDIGVEDLKPVQNDSIDKNVVRILDTSLIKETYQIAVLIPFFFEENRLAQQKCPPIGDCPVYSHTLRALDFHHGVLMAIDSLKKAGLNVVVNIYDTKNDTVEVAKILSKSEFSDIDLIIGPFYARQIKLVADYAKNHQVQMICPVPVSNKALFNNPYLSKLIASTPTQIEYLAKYVAQNHHDDNVVVIRNSKDEKDDYNFRTFKKAYNSEILKYPNRLNDSLIESVVNSSGSRLTSIESKLRGDTNNVIVVPSENVGLVSTFFTKLSSTSNSNPYRTYSIDLFGLEDWMNFETIDEKYKNKYNLKIATSGFVNFNEKEVVKFIEEYRSVYSTDPSKYSFIGFDAAFNSLKGLLLYGTQYPSKYSSLRNKGYFTNVDFNQVDTSSGYENQGVIIIHHNDYHVEKLDK